MIELSNIRTIKELLAKYGFHFSKSLGQNFLINPHVCPKMANAVLEDGITKAILEVGPGIGVLTNELAKYAEKVVSVELDTRLMPILKDTLSDFSNVHIVNDDFLTLDLPQLLQDEFEELPFAFCANLPYYITSPIIMHLLESKLPFTNIVVMVQKEAAERLCTPVGTRQAGAITVAVEYYAESKILFPVSRGSFMPAPNVDSSVIQLIPRKAPPSPVQDEAFFFAMVKAAFAQRRKTFVNAVNAGLSIDKDSIKAVLLDLNQQENVRVEKLTLEELIAISNALYAVAKIQ